MAAMAVPEHDPHAEGMLCTQTSTCAGCAWARGIIQHQSGLLFPCKLPSSPLHPLPPCLPPPFPCLYPSSHRAREGRQQAPFLRQNKRREVVIRRGRLRPRRAPRPPTHHHRAPRCDAAAARRVYRLQHGPHLPRVLGLGPHSARDQEMRPRGGNERCRPS